MSTIVTPLGENVLIESIVVAEKTVSGIYLPETASQDKPQEGKVLAVGSSDDIVVTKGQRVIYNKYAGTEVTVDGDVCLIVKNEDILAVIA